MVYILSKVLLILLKPLFWLSCLFVYAIFSKNKTRRNRLFVAILVCLFLLSNRFIVGKVYNAYEAGYPQVRHHDIGIVLGGFSTYDETKKNIIFNSSGNRLFEGILLYQKGNIETILISGGNANLVDNEVKEADLAAIYLKKVGIPDSVIVVENQSRNTLENAALSFRKVQQVDPQATILVITSAWHIPRARLNFSKYFKKNIDYYPSNFLGKSSYSLTDYFVPSTSSFRDWNFILKEWAGLLVDRFRS